MPRAALIPLILACLSAQPLPDLRPETVLLAEAREKMIHLLANQPNYTCLETVERTRQIPGGGPQVQDTLRLEVALVDNKEMFAWPGAKSFEDQDIREMISTGMFGNGNYAIYARMLFRGDGPAFVYRGPVALNGTTVERYDFAVPRSRSGYHLRVDQSEVVTGFHGSIYLDPLHAELRRLEVIADDIPAELGLTAAEDRVDYGRVLIGDEEFLLPLESSLLMAGKDQISRNHVRFSGCRKFAGESSLIFDDPEFAEQAEAPVLAELQLPPGTQLALTIESDLVLEKAAAGDAVTARLQSAVKQGKQTLVPKGAAAKGRLIYLERAAGYYTLAIQFQELEWKGGHATVRAKFDRLGGMSLAGRPRILATADGMLRLLQSGGRAMKGELLFFRTVP